MIMRGFVALKSGGFVEEGRKGLPCLKGRAFFLLRLLLAEPAKFSRRPAHAREKLTVTEVAFWPGTLRYGRVNVACDDSHVPQTKGETRCRV